MDQEKVLGLMIAPPGRMRDSWDVLLRATTSFTTIVHADDGAQGVQLMVQCPPAWVFLDGDLADAWQTLRRLRKKWPETCCLVLVHRVMQEKRARALGAQGVVPGNCSLEQLKTVMRTLQANKSF